MKLRNFEFKFEIIREKLELELSMRDEEINLKHYPNTTWRAIFIYLSSTRRMKGIILLG